MYYLIPIPIMFVAAIVYHVSTYCKLKSFVFISKVAIVASVLLFVYLYAAYNGYDLLDYLSTFFKF